MPEVQAKRLMEMMHYTPLSQYLGVSLLPLHVKNSSLNMLTVGDVILLPIHKMEVMIHDDNGSILANGLYGNYKNIPSVLVESIYKESLNTSDSKKYKKLRISLGTIERRELERGKIMALHQDSNYDATLYRDNKILAQALLVQIDQKIALHIKEVK